MSRTRSRIPRGPRWPRCTRCRVEFEPSRINSKGHCPSCADEMNEKHPQFSGIFHEPR